MSGPVPKVDYVRVATVMTTSVISATIWAHPAQAAPRRFDVPALPLEQALRRVSEQGQVQILFSGDQVRAHNGAAVSGKLEAEAAFRRVLSRSGLSIRQIDARTFIVVSPPAPRLVARPVPTPRAVDTAEPVREVVVVAQRTILNPRQDTDRFDGSLSAPQATAILSRSDLERTVARNVTEALGVLPGVTVLNTGRSFSGGVDSASRAEGLFSAFRGLNTEFNLNMIDGVSLAQGLPHSRGVQLNLLPPTGFQSIVLSKVPTPDMDGDVISAAIDFRTPTANDFRARQHLSLSVSAYDNRRAETYSVSGLGGGVGVEYARRFGDDERFGLYFSHTEERRRYANSEIAGIMSAQNDAGWAYLSSDSAKGTLPAGADPQSLLTATALNVGASTGESRARYDVLTLTGRFNDHWDGWLRATAAHNRTEQNSTLGQVVGRNLSWVDNGSGRYHLSVGSVSSRLWYETNPDVASLSAVSVGARRQAGAWTLTPSLFFSQGRSDRPDRIEASARVDQVDRYNSAQRRPYTGLLIGYTDGVPTPQLTPDLRADLDSVGERLLARRAGQFTVQTSRQYRQGARFDAEYTAYDRALRHLAFGVKWSDSVREVTDRNWTNTHFADLLGRAGLTWEALGLIRGYYDQAFPGRFDWRLPKVDHERLADYFHNYVTPQSFDTCATLAVNNDNCNRQHGRETVAAAYLSGRLMVGRLEIAPGLRYERTRIDSRFWVLPPQPPGVEEVAGYWDQNRRVFSLNLPSLRINYRPDDEHVYRIALWRGYARPAFMLLGSGVRYQVADDDTPLLRQGNPALEPVTSLNFDLAMERRSPDGIDYAFGTYAKRLDHYLFDSGGGGNLFGRSLDPMVLTPRNGGRGLVWGVEAEARQYWSVKGGALSLGGTVSRQWTRVDLGSDELGRNIAMQNAPDWLANLRTSYRYKRATVTLSAQHTGAYLSSYNALSAPGDWDNVWVRPATRLDLSADWQVRPRLRLSLSATNLTGAYSYWAHVGKDSLALSDIIDSGQRLTLSLRYDL
ncbi:TonB-dependent receptor [Asticcacaulis excentricus]|uniref:TonB-dependent receptor n=1 Tax=Asticcacaulis excentricus TaxID=78587 RepID=A0A3G9GCZ1_9CAUL|nr:TonB-dependent receptor [Asticcacaulis excentricus]BBF82589.1 TonB-dependent receptor [Asticcacaulis excentricus]